MKRYCILLCGVFFLLLMCGCQSRSSQEQKETKEAHIEKADAVLESQSKSEPFSLSGIVYDPSGESFATINGYPVKEGALVEGYSVASISKDAVVLTKDGEEHRIVSKSPYGGVSRQHVEDALLRARLEKEFEESVKVTKIRSEVQAEYVSKDLEAKENYTKAVSSFRKAEREDDLKRALSYYEQALQYAQFSLDHDRLDAVMRQEIESIIDDSRERITSTREKSDRKKAMESCKRDGRDYAALAAHYHSRRSEKPAREYYQRAIDYYEQALRYADDASDRNQIEYTIKSLRSDLQDLWIINE